MLILSVQEKQLAGKERKESGRTASTQISRNKNLVPRAALVSRVESATMTDGPQALLRSVQNKAFLVKCWSRNGFQGRLCAGPSNS